MAIGDRTKGNGNKMEIRLSYGFRAVLMGFFLVGLTAASEPTAKNPTAIELKVGVVQRFGDEVTDEMTLQAAPGDRLTVRFAYGENPQTLQANSIKFETVMQPLEKSVVDERVVLNNHGTFETAEDSANQWRSQGIEVEIAQPERWEVWAKRDVYKTPLLRRLLLQSLQAQGNTSAHLETKVLTSAPQASLVVNGYRYSRTQFEIKSDKNPIQVKEGKDDTTPTLYPGILRIQPNAYGSYTLINQVPLETYLRGVVPHEIGAGAPYASIEAQTILARTYALRNLRRFAVDGYELCASIHCQVYEGLTGIDANADRAIAATTGKVLTYGNELVDALYSSTTGGVTAPFSDVWNGTERPYLKAVLDSSATVWDLSRQNLSQEANFRRFISLQQGFNETGQPAFRWRRVGQLTDLAADLRRYLQKNRSEQADFTTIKQMQVVARSPSGRILKLVVQTDKGNIELLKNEVRSALGPPRSTLFYLEPVYDANKVLKAYAFVGGGFGHGVGMSQTGSYHLAKLGRQSAQILSFYYPGTQIQPLSEAIVFWRDSHSQPILK